MVRQVRAILKEEGDLQDRLHRSRLRARREGRESRIARLGVTLNEEAEKETHGFVDDPEMYIRSVRLEDDAEGMEEIEEESEEAIEVEVEVDTDAADRDADVESGGDEPAPEEMQEDGEESESYASTDYGSLQLIQEDFEAFENLDPMHTTTTGGNFSAMREEWSTMWSSSWHGFGDCL